jgi:hypothetical protein
MGGEWKQGNTERERRTPARDTASLTRFGGAHVFLILLAILFVCFFIISSSFSALSLCPFCGLFFFPCSNRRLGFLFFGQLAQADTIHSLYRLTGLVQFARSALTYPPYTVPPIPPREIKTHSTTVFSPAGWRMTNPTRRNPKHQTGTNLGKQQKMIQGRKWKSGKE